MGLCCIYSCDYFIHLAVFLKVIHVDKEAVIANDQVLCVVAVGTFHFYEYNAMYPIACSCT